MLDQIKNQIKEVLVDAGIKGELNLVIPPNPEMGDLALGCFGLGKNSKKTAEEIVKKLEGKKLGIVEKIEAFGPYVNFTLKISELAKLVLNGDLSGTSNPGKGKKVLIEYPSQNTHKEIHIGHLRNVCIGNALVQLFRKTGHKMIPMNYVNDFGAHVVKVLWYIKSKNLKVKSEKNKQKWLGEVYAEANKYIKDHSEVKDELVDFQKKFEARDKEIWKLFKQTKKWSTDGFKKILDELEVEHDSIIYESEVKEHGQKIVDELLKKKIAKVGDGGAIIIDLEKEGLGIALLRKSSGAGLYMTSDLALAEKKFEKYKVDESINITATEQNFYFKQLFKVLELNGFKSKMTHVGYGLVNLPGGKMSSRAGNVILYEDLRDEIYNHMKKETVKRHEDWSEKKIEKTVHTLTMAILKFTMQKTEANKNITFDFKEAVSFEGYSAPYILYVVARINSILRKTTLKQVQGKVDNLKFELLNTPEEKRLLMMMAEFSGVVEKAWQDYNPAVITRYSFDLAKAFNDFYNKYSILSADSKELVQARLFLSGKVKGVLKEALNVLTIGIVEEM